MTITIKFSNNIEHIYNSFDDILQLDNYNDIFYINCNGNSLTSLPNLPNSLQELRCSNNYLYSLNSNNRPPNNPLNKPLTIVFCLPGNKFSNHFLLSWSELLIYCFTHNIKPFISCQQSSNVYHVRSMCLGADVIKGTKQKPFNGMDYDFIMWIDSDQVFSVEAFTNLLRHNKDVVSGMYLMKSGTHFPVVENWDENYFIENGTFHIFFCSKY